jgi:hypothetical protein
MRRPIIFHHYTRIARDKQRCETLNEQMCSLKIFMQYLVHVLTKMVGNTNQILTPSSKLSSKAFTFECSGNHMSLMTHCFRKQRNPSEPGRLCVLSLQKTTLT